MKKAISDIRRDHPWIMGMFPESAIRIARISLPPFEDLADAMIRKESSGH
jgi:hypothetical protein